MIPRSPSLTVQLASFEYGCCRTAPVVGEVLSVVLFAHPADRVASVTPVGWDAERQLVVVDGGSALWACDDDFDWFTPHYSGPLRLVDGTAISDDHDVQLRALRVQTDRATAAL